MKFCFHILLIFFIPFFSSCAEDDEDLQYETDGYKMVLFGNSFFRPYAQKFSEMALDAGFDNHNAVIISRGGENGNPFNLWNDSTTAEHMEIKQALDEGNIDVLGMVAGLLQENPTDGYRDWIEYALVNNPDITVFFSIIQPDFPDDWDSITTELGYSSIQEAYDNMVNIRKDSLINKLRVEFPENNIFSIPTGQATFTLYQLQKDSLLLDSISYRGNRENSLFTDEKGHQGDIIINTGALMWLESIYSIDLDENDYETGFNTDLHSIAQGILDSYNQNLNYLNEFYQQVKWER